MSLVRSIHTFACVTPTLSSRNRVIKANAANIHSPSLSDGILPQSKHRTKTILCKVLQRGAKRRQLARQPWNKRHEYGNNKKKWVELNNEGYAYDWSDFGLPGCDRASYDQNMCRHCHLADINTTTETLNASLYLMFKILISEDPSVTGTNIIKAILQLYKNHYIV